MSALLTQMSELRAELTTMRGQLDSSRQETQQLRSELQELREQVQATTPQTASNSQGADQLTSNDRLSNLAEEQQLLNAKVEEQHQTKVESGSKYRVRLSGMALLNVFSTSGSVDNIDVPAIAQHRTAGDSNGSVGASVRQSVIGLEVLGPQLGGAKTSGDLQFDFFGGFPSATEGVTSGLVRMRTARLSLDWANTSIKGGQDAPFFSPLSPTSLAAAGYPAFSYSGNMWTWTPEIHVEHRFAVGEDSKALLQIGLLDALTGELPDEYVRVKTAGERSRAPAYAMRLAWERGTPQRRAALGAGAYYSRQNWGFDRTVDAWAATADWEIPLRPWLSLSGEVYRGRSIAGLGASAAGSVLFIGSPSESTSGVLPLNSAGGWSQLKFKPLPKLEFNGAFGEDYPFHSDLGRHLAQRGVEGVSAGRNASGFVNFIYQPRSNLLLSLEYRRLWTSGLYYPAIKAGHVNLGAGIIF